MTDQAARRPPHNAKHRCTRDSPYGMVPELLRAFFNAKRAGTPEARGSTAHEAN